MSEGIMRPCSSQISISSLNPSNGTSTTSLLDHDRGLKTRSDLPSPVVSILAATVLRDSEIIEFTVLKMNSKHASESL